MGKIYFNGVELTETYGMEILGRGTYGAPARDIEQVHVPGRNGDLLFDNGGYMNYDLTYPECCIAENFPVYGAQLRNFLLSDPGYHKLYDSYDMRHYRLAEFRGPFLPDVHTARNNQSAVFDLSFNCRPFRYLQEVGYENIIFCIGSTWKTQTVLPASADGEYTIRCVNSGSSSRTFYVYKFGSTSAIGSATVAAGSEATIYISTDISDVLYADVTISTGGNIAIYSNGQLVYSISGNSSEQVSKIYNPYVYTALPLISTYSFVGAITVGGKTLSKPNRIYDINVDSEIRMAYRGDGTLANSSISGDFPVLGPGLNEITVTTNDSSTVSSVRMTPRFCML